MARYASYVSHQVMDELFELGPDVQRVFQDKLDALEKEPYKGTSRLPDPPREEEGWTSRTATIKSLRLSSGLEVRAILYFKVRMGEIKVSSFAMRPVDPEVLTPITDDV